MEESRGSASKPLNQRDYIRKSIGYYTEALDNDFMSKHTANILLNLARLYLTIDEPKDAMSCCECCIHYYPDCERAYEMKGTVK